MAYIGFLKPSLYSFGILPEWSMCAWVSSIKSNSFTSNAKGDEFSHSSCAAPWYIPQSTKNFLPAASTKKLEPVTVFVAPKKVTFIKIPLFPKGTPLFRKFLLKGTPLLTNYINFCMYIFSTTLKGCPF